MNVEIKFTIHEDQAAFLTVERCPHFHVSWWSPLMLWNVQAGVRIGILLRGIRGIVKSMEFRRNLLLPVQ